MRGAPFFLALMLGLLVTLLSGFYGQDHGTAGKKDIGYGIPVNWHGEQGFTHPNSPPLTGWFSWQNFVYDTLAWWILFSILALILRRRPQVKRPMDNGKESTRLNSRRTQTAFTTARVNQILSESMFFASRASLARYPKNSKRAHRHFLNFPF